MITLPYEFDTSRIWQQIVKIAFGIGGVLAVAILGSLASGKFAGAIGVTLALTIFLGIAWRARAFPMGAAGVLTRTGVETQPVKVLWYSLPVPVGRFSIDRFQSVAVVENAVMGPVGTNGGPDQGGVLLIGKPETPHIQVAFTDIDRAIGVARELATLLQLGYQRLDGAESRTFLLNLIKRG